MTKKNDYKRKKKIYSTLKLEEQVSMFNPHFLNRFNVRHKVGNELLSKSK